MNQSLALIIAGYRTGVADFNANAPAHDHEAFDAYAGVSFGPFLDQIREFKGPATSIDEARISLELALEQIGEGDVDTAESLVRAAALYLREVCRD